MSSETCANCPIRYMRQQGCCTSDVGFGLKRMRQGQKMHYVCAKLEKGPGKTTYCGAYSSRPDECKQFVCPKLTGEDDLINLDDIIDMLPDADDDSAWPDHSR